MFLPPADVFKIPFEVKGFQMPSFIKTGKLAKECVDRMSPFSVIFFANVLVPLQESIFADADFIYFLNGLDLLDPSYTKIL